MGMWDCKGMVGATCMARDARVLPRGGGKDNSGGYQTGHCFVWRTAPPPPPGGGASASGFWNFFNFFEFFFEFFQIPKFQVPKNSQKNSKNIPKTDRGGAQRPKKSLCTPNRPPISGPFDKFHSLPEKKFSDVGGWGGRPGLARAPNNPPPPRGSQSKGLIPNIAPNIAAVRAEL